GLVQLEAAKAGEVIREKLQRYQGEERVEEIGRRWYRQHVFDTLRHPRVSGVAHRDHAAVTGPHLLYVGDHAVVGGISRRQHYHGHPLVDQRDGTVLHLTGGVPLGVDVGDLLELERTLERTRVLDPAAEEEKPLTRRQLAGERADGP